MKFSALRLALLLLLQHCGSPGTIEDRATNQGDSGPKKSGELSPSAEGQGPSVQIAVNDLKTSLLARRSCRPSSSPTLAPVSFSSRDSIDEFIGTPNFANAPNSNWPGVTEIHYGKDAKGLGIAILTTDLSFQSFLIEIDGLVVGDNLRSENLRTYLLDAQGLRVHENGSWTPVDPAKYATTQNTGVTKLFIHQSLVSEAWNWPAWSIRTSAVSSRAGTVTSLQTGSWITFASELGGDISNLLVQECKKTLENGQVVTVQIISDKRQEASRIQNTVDLAYTALLQSLPTAVGDALPINQFAWVITDRSGGQSPYRQLEERRRVLLDYSNTFFLKLDPNFADEGYFKDSAKEELFFNVIFDLISRITDITASFDAGAASLVATAVAEERLETAFGIPAGLYFNRNQSLPSSLSKVRGSVLLSHVMPSRILLQELSHTFKSTSNPQLYQERLAQNLRSYVEASKARQLEAALQGWLSGDNYSLGMGPENLGDTDWDGIPDALENLLGYNLFKGDTIGGGLGDLGRLSAVNYGLALAKKPSEIVLDGIIDDWKSLIPQTLNSDKDETLNSCSPAANINLFGALQSAKNLAVVLLSKSKDSTKAVDWSIQVDNPKKDTHFLAFASTGSQEMTLFRSEDLSNPLKTWRLNGLIGKDAWELFIPLDFLGVDSAAKDAMPLKVRVTAHESGKVCDDTPWFNASLAR